MKTKLLATIFTVGLFSIASMAQTKVWDFGNDTATWPLSSGIGSGTEEVIVDMLGLFPIETNTNFGAVTSNNSTFSDGYTATQRFQMNGGGSPDAEVAPFMPTQRYLFLDVDSDCTVKIWFRPGSNGSVRTIFVTDGSALVGSGSSGSGDTPDYVIFTANYTEANGGRLYIYGDQANNLYKIEVNGANVVTGTNAVGDHVANAGVSVFSNGKIVFVSNVQSATNVAVYSLTGALVKSFETTEDMSMDFLTSGLYIVNVQSAEGQKSVKVLVQ